MTTYQEIIPQLLEIVPDLKSKYEELNEEFSADLSDKDIAELESISKAHGLQPREAGKAGLTIVFENLLAPYIASLTSVKIDKEKLAEIMDWLEKLSNSGDFNISNLVAGSICEPLITTHQSNLSLIYPYMGKKMRELCKMQFSRFIVSDEIKKMFAG